MWLSIQNLNFKILPLELFWVVVWSLFLTWPSSQLAVCEKSERRDRFIQWRGWSYDKAWLWTRIGHPGLGRCFRLVYGLLGYVCVHVHIVVCVATRTCISVSVHVCASASHCWGPYLSWHRNYVCIFIFPTLLVRHQTCPDSSCPPGRLAPPPPTLCPMPPRYAPDASQLVCCLCGARRLLETDARATVAACLRICVRGQPWARTVTFTAGRDSWKE